MTMTKYSRVRATCLARSGPLIVVVLLSACDPFALIEEATEEEGQARTAADRARRSGTEARVVKVLRGDLIEAAFGGATQQVHVAGVCSPSLREDAFNRTISEREGLPLKWLPKYGEQAVRFTRDVTLNRPLRIVARRVQTNGAGAVAVDGDVVFLNGSSLAEKLLAEGFATVLPDASDTLIDLVEVQGEARRAERGLWRNPVPIAQRFNVRSDYEVETLAVDRDSTQAGDGERVETYRMSQKQAVVTLDIAVRKPMWAPYRGLLRYAFHTREESGKRVQLMTPTPVVREARASGRGYKPLSSEERSRVKQEHKDVRDYNKEVDGGAVTKMGKTETATMPFELATLRTTLVVRSAVEDYLSATKAGISYNQGKTFRGYDLEILIGTNVVYRHLHENRGASL
jgi:endonuclease YncB( thermonuclease family)